MSNVGTLYVIAAPSGTGKTTLVKALVDALPKLAVSISHTTRKKRANETEGVSYHFIHRDEFEQMIAQGDFLEHATIFGHLYGTSKKWVEQTLNLGIDVILEIDWQGHRQIKKLFPECIDIFILPPSAQALRERLLTRNQDDANVIKNRLANVKEAVTHVHEFDYVVINDDFVSALHDLKTLIEAGHLLQRRQMAKHEKLVKELSESAESMV